MGYWLFNASSLSCSILDSSSRQCQGMTGPAYPDYDECVETPTTNTGFIVTGGAGAERSAELINLENNHCVLPNLPDGRGAHTQNGPLLCGGYDTRTTCLLFSDGQ